MLMIPRTKFKTRGDRSFAGAAPKLWNKLPVQVIIIVFNVMSAESPES